MEKGKRTWLKWFIEKVIVPLVAALIAGSVIVVSVTVATGHSDTLREILVIFLGEDERTPIATNPTVIATSTLDQPSITFTPMNTSIPIEEPTEIATSITLTHTLTPTVTNTLSHTPTTTYAATVTPSYTPTPMSIFRTINGNADPDAVQNITKVDCLPSGRYEVKYESGSYFVNSEYGWRTVLLIIVDRPFEWSNEYLINPQPDFDYFVGNFGANGGETDGYPTSQAAEDAYQPSASFDCHDYMLIMPMDIRGSYNGERSSSSFNDQNRGSVTISIVT